MVDWGEHGRQGVPAATDIFLFEQFRLDRRGDGLSRRSERGVFVPVPMGLRALDILNVLVERSGDLVTKEEIMAAVWGRTVVENANLTVQISALRRVLDEGRTEDSCIQTVAARGYRFVAPVIRVEDGTARLSVGAQIEDMSATRRLMAILAADVAGYSRLMGADEEGTLARLKAHRRELVDPKIAEYRGRIVKTTGDGLLVEFGSVVDAVRCAAEIQRGMLDRDRGDVPEDRRISFRIGVNLGDVIVDGGDIFGDGVNVAARLEALAAPGGVCISHTVRDQIHDKLPYALDDLGEQFVKNIVRPVRAYALSPETVVGLPAASVSRAATPGRSYAKPMMISGAAMAMLVIAGVSWWLWPAPRQPSAEAPVAASAPQQLKAPRLSIVVLPFANLSNDPDQQYFADGITEDLTTDLSRLPNMLVIARNTAFTYKDKPVDAKQIGRELGVRYLLEGSVQRSGNQVRVTTQLIDAETGTHLYAERFDRTLGDLFALQNDVTSRIAVALNLELVAAEAARPSTNPDVLEYILRGRAATAKPPTRESYAEGIGLYERALAADPDSVDAQRWLAGGLAGRVLDGFSSSPDEDIRRAEALLAPALAASPGNPFLHYVKGQILRAVAQGPFRLDAEARIARFADAIPEYETVLAANPNAVNVLAHLAWCRFMTGAEKEAIPLLEKAIHLSPRDPFLYLWYTRLGTVQLFQGHLDEAILWLEKARRANPPFPVPHAFLAAAYGLKGDTAHAAAELAEFNERARGHNDNRFGTIALVRKNADLNTPPLHDRFEEFVVIGLRKAGLPED
jgi:TolB-like protein/class 3 adenylate cyclase